MGHTIQTQAHKRGGYGRQAEATRPERRTPPLRETHDGRQMKGDKAKTRPKRRTPPLRETYEDRQMKGEGTDKTGEADTTTQGDT